MSSLIRSNISLMPANICCLSSSCSGFNSLNLTSVDSLVVSTGMFPVLQFTRFLGGDFCALVFSSRIRLLFLVVAVIPAFGFNCSFMLVCQVAPVDFELFALAVILSVTFLSVEASILESFLFDLIVFNVLSKLLLLS